MAGRMEELATMTTSTLGDLIRVQMAEEIEEAVKPLRVWGALETINNQLLGKEGNKLEFFKRGKLDVHGSAFDKVSEGSDISEDEPDYSKILNITVYKRARASVISKEAIEDARVDLVDDAKFELAEYHATLRDLDTYLTAVKGVEKVDATNTGDGSTTSFTISPPPVAYIVKCTVGADDWMSKISSFKAETGVVSFSEAPPSGATISITFYQITGQYKTTSESQKVAVADLNAARSTIAAARKRQPTLLFVSDKFYGKILEGLSSLYIDRAKYGAGEELLNNELGKILGMKVIVSSQIADDLAVACVPDRTLMVVPKRKMTVTVKENPKNEVLKVFASQRYGMGLLREDSICSVILKA